MEPYALLIAVFGIFIPALVLPGPDFVAVVRSSMTRGPAAGLATAAGVSATLGFYATLSMLGLSAILVEHQWLAWAVRLAGGAYLVWLGLKLLRAKAPTAEDGAAPGGDVRGNPLLFGVSVTLTNPKAIVLFTGVFATAVTAATPVWLMALAVGLVIASSLAWYTAVALFMSSGPVMVRFRGARHWIERAAGVCFIGIGGKILADARNPVAP